MARPTEQSDKCLERDHAWLLRIRRRARDSTVRSPKKNAALMMCLNEAIKILAADIEAVMSKSGKRKSRTTDAAAE